MTVPRTHDIQKRDWLIDPLTLLNAWPSDRPVVMLHSGRVDRQWARWSIFAEPAATVTIDKHIRWHGRPAHERINPTSTDDPLADLQRWLDATVHGRGTPVRGANHVPFTGGWIGCVAYDLGRVIEPRAAHPHAPADDRRWPMIQLAWCPHALVYDHLDAQWYEVNTSDAPTWLGQCIDIVQKSHQIQPTHDMSPGGFTLGRIAAHVPPDAYLHMVQRALDYIAAGDIFQANITQRLSASFDGSTRALARHAFAASGAWYGAYLEWPDGRTVLSLSPELLLKIDDRPDACDTPPRHVITRPIKGTRPGHVSPQELEASEKDAAELNMIIDLMRNDLGRVCEYGSVRVPYGRIIESHPTVHHGVGEVHGTLRDDVTFTDVLRAVFPGGSVTGAPKIRAMQIIDELEPVRRGPYCGSIACISTDGNVQLNIAIRTIALHGERPANRMDQLHGTLDYGTGGGIVADSDHAEELRECSDKAAVLRMVAQMQQITESH